MRRNFANDQLVLDEVKQVTCDDLEKPDCASNREKCSAWNWRPLVTIVLRRTPVLEDWLWTEILGLGQRHDRKASEVVRNHFLQGTIRMVVRSTLNAAPRTDDGGLSAAALVAITLNDADRARCRLQNAAADRVGFLVDITVDGAGADRVEIVRDLCQTW